jgi:hypothetical protein
MVNNIIDHSQAKKLITMLTLDYLSFVILSHTLSYIDFGYTEGIIWEKQEDSPGTSVYLKIEKNSQTRLKDVFDKYADPEKDPSFRKTIIPIKLMEYEGNLSSRGPRKSD